MGLRTVAGRAGAAWLRTKRFPWPAQAAELGVDAVLLSAGARLTVKAVSAGSAPGVGDVQCWSATLNYDAERRVRAERGEDCVTGAIVQLFFDFVGDVQLFSFTIGATAGRQSLPAFNVLLPMATG